MRADKLLINADPESIAAFERELPFKAAAALVLVFSFAVMAVSAPAHASVERASTASVAVSAAEPLADRHDFINPQKSTEAASSTVELERLFWMCDYAAGTGTLDAHEIEMCSAATQQIRLAKFAGDSEKLLAWWRLSKDAEHKMLLGTAVIGQCAQGDGAG